MISTQQHLQSLPDSTGARLCAQRQPQQCPHGCGWSATQPRSAKWTRPHLPKLAALAALAMLMTGCDPTLNLYGTFIPAWLICMAAGTVGAVAFRYLFAALKLEQHLGPLILVYPCLVLLLSCATWILFFQS